MKKIDCIFYLVDNYLYICNMKNIEINKYKFENYLNDGRIIKPKIFIKKLNEILKNKKLIKLFTGQNAIIIYEPHLKYIDKKIIIDTFDQCGFKNLKLVNAKNILNRNNCFIEINNNYLIVYNEKKYSVINFNVYFNVKTILNQIVKYINTDIFVFGINEQISELVNISDKLFYLENSDKYLINEIIKKYNKINKN